MKKVFLYYSLSGNGDIVSKIFKDNDYNIIKVTTKEELPKPFFLRMLVGGFKASIGYKDKINDISLEEYDKVIIGSPIWNSRISSPINSVLDKYDLSNKKISFVFYSGSGTSKKATEVISKKYSNVKIINLKEPKKNKDELDKLKEII